MSAFRGRMLETQRECDRLLGNRNARLRFDMRLSDPIDVGGNGLADSWRVWVESADGTILASGQGNSGGNAYDALLAALKEKKR